MKKQTNYVIQVKNIEMFDGNSEWVDYSILSPNLDVTIKMFKSYSAKSSREFRVVDEFGKVIAE